MSFTYCLRRAFSCHSPYAPNPLLVDLSQPSISLLKLPVGPDGWPLKNWKGSPKGSLVELNSCDIYLLSDIICSSLDALPSCGDNQAASSLYLTSSGSLSPLCWHRQSPKSSCCIWIISFRSWVSRLFEGFSKGSGIVGGFFYFEFPLDEIFCTFILFFNNFLFLIVIWIDKMVNWGN